MQDLVTVLALGRLASCPQAAELRICLSEQMLLAGQAGSAASSCFQDLAFFGSLNS